MKVKLSVSNIILLNTAQTSCEALVQAQVSGTAPSSDKSAVSLSIPAITITWTNQNQPIVIQYINIILNGTAFATPFGYQIGAEELGYDWMGAGYCPGGFQAGPPGGTAGNCYSGPIEISYNSPTTMGALTANNAGSSAPVAVPSSSQCGTTVGSIPIPDTTQSYAGGATIVVYGIYTDGSGNQNPVTGEAAASWTYTGVP